MIGKKSAIRMLLVVPLAALMAATMPVPDPVGGVEPLPVPAADCGWVIHCTSNSCTGATAECWDSTDGTARPAGKTCTDDNGDGCYCCK